MEKEKNNMEDLNGKNYGCFVKFSNHTQDIMNGKLYCKNLNYYRHVEQGEEGNGLKDREEGVWRESLNASLNSNFIVKGIAKKYVDGQNTFLFCVTSLKPLSIENGKMFFKLSEEQCYKFKKMYYNEKTYKLDPVGNVVITKPDDFIMKIEAACKGEGISCFHSLVGYTKEKTPVAFSALRARAEQLGNKLPDSLLSCFIKNDRYSWQVEYRFLFYDVPKHLIEGDHFSLNIGNLNIKTTEGEFLAYENVEAFPKDMKAFIK